MVNHVKRMAEMMEVVIPEPICYLDMPKSNPGICDCKRPIGYIIDDFERVLHNMTGGVPTSSIYTSIE
jgi:hypothetical protein